MGRARAGRHCVLISPSPSAPLFAPIASLPLAMLMHALISCLLKAVLVLARVAHFHVPAQTAPMRSQRARIGNRWPRRGVWLQVSALFSVGFVVQVLTQLAYVRPCPVCCCYSSGYCTL